MIFRSFNRRTICAASAPARRKLTIPAPVSGVRDPSVSAPFQAVLLLARYQSLNSLRHILDTYFQHKIQCRPQTIATNGIQRSAFVAGGVGPECQSRPAWSTALHWSTSSTGRTLSCASCLTYNTPQPSGPSSHLWPSAAKASMWAVFTSRETPQALV